MDAALCTLTASIWLACQIDDFSIGKMFTENKKKFIVKAFGQNPSLTKVKQEFLREYKIEKERRTAKYKLYQFFRVNKEFEKRGL